MCGVAGILSDPLSNLEVDAFKDLMIISTVRGYEGSGVATMRAGKQTNHTRIWKQTCTGAYLVTQKGFEEVIKHPLKLLMGHTRWPTRGENKPEFCHPFREGHIVGMHNGTLHKINNTFPSFQESDSNFFFKEMAKSGIEPVIKNSSGAYALVWVDEDKRTLNFLRNHDRTLFFASHAHYNTVMWASEPGFLQAVIDRRWHGSKEWTISILPVNTLRSFTLKDVKVKEPAERELKPEIFPAYAGHRQGSYYGSDYEAAEMEVSRDFDRRFPSTGSRPPFHQQHHRNHLRTIISDKQKTPSEVARTVPLIGGPKKAEVIDMRPVANSDPNNTVAMRISGTDSHTVLENKDVVSKILNRGCMGCGNPGEMLDVDKVLWLDRVNFMCTGCQENPDWKDYLPGKPAKSIIL